MRLPQFTKLNRHRSFDYTPMYYNPAKEELDERVRAIKAEIGSEGADENITREAKMRAQFRKNSESMEFQSKKKSGAIRMVIILVVIVYLSYLVFNNLEGFLAKLI